MEGGAFLPARLRLEPEPNNKTDTQRQTELAIPTTQRSIFKHLFNYMSGWTGLITYPVGQGLFNF